MDQSERRDEIKRILFLRRYDTIDNLARDLDVSPRTIRRDLEILCLKEAIYTVPGRGTGGVYALENFNPNFKRFTEKEVKVFTKVICFLEREKVPAFSEEEIIILKIILQTYTKRSKEDRL